MNNTRFTQKALLLAMAITLQFGSLAAQKFSSIQNGIQFKVQSVQVEVQFYSPSAVRVVKYPEGTILKKESLSVIKKPEAVSLSQQTTNNKVELKSPQIVVAADLQTGKISFSDVSGNPLFTEKDYGTQFTPSHDGQRNSYLARQAFLLEKDEPVYGLGQQQNGRLNQRYQRNNLQNENTRVCIPFFQSIKGYGIFWDSYAPTLFTDNMQETS